MSDSLAGYPSCHLTHPSVFSWRGSHVLWGWPIITILVVVSVPLAFGTCALIDAVGKTAIAAWSAYRSHNVEK